MASAPAHSWARGAALVDQARFWLYRNVIALKEWHEFRATEIIPLAAPTEGRVEYRPFTEVHPGMPIRGLYEAVTFPAEDRAGPRLRRIRLGRRALDLLTVLAPRHTPPIPRDIDAFLSVVYPLGYRRAWPTAPAVPPELAQPEADVLAELAVRAPFGSYLRRSASGAGEGTYEIDLRWMNAYPVREGLAPPGGLARFAVRDGHLGTVSVQQDGVPADLARAALLAGLNEDLTTFRHNLSTHLTTLTSFALATANGLGARHPVRRLLHHCFHTVLIGNVEVAEFQVGRPRGFSSTIFSHEGPVLVGMADDHVARYDFWDFEPDTQFARRGTTETPFAYPYRDNVLRLWAATAAYVEDYLRLYYAGDAAVAADPQLTLLDRGARPPPSPRRHPPGSAGVVPVAGPALRHIDPRLDGRARRAQQHRLELLDARLDRPDGGAPVRGGHGPAAGLRPRRDDHRHLEAVQHAAHRRHPETGPRPGGGSRDAAVDRPPRGDPAGHDRGAVRPVDLPPAAT